MIIVTVGDKVTPFLEVLKNQERQSLFRYIRSEEIESHREHLSNTGIVFVLHLKEFGVNLQMEHLIHRLATMYKNNTDVFRHSVGAIWISSDEEDYTKLTASNLVYRLNKMGLSFIGRPIVEAPKGLKNFLGQSVRENKKPEEVLFAECNAMIQRIQDHFEEKRLLTDLEQARKQLAVIHCSNPYSNTLALWKMVQQTLEPHFNLREIALGNGEIQDCRACGYQACKTFGMNDRCYYEGTMVDEIYPAIAESDGIVLVCPNYNDALSANLTAMINRLTALFRKHKFYDKVLYAVIVSGSSGNEALATQLIRALAMNKTFCLPPYFSLSTIANSRGAIFEVENIEKKAKSFAEKIIEYNS